MPKSKNINKQLKSLVADFQRLEDQIKAADDFEHPTRDALMECLRTNIMFLQDTSDSKESSALKLAMATTFSNALTPLIADYKEAHKRSMTDSLTTLWNKDYFEQQVDMTLGRLDRDVDEDAFLMFIDIDDFKQYNSNYGDSVGDATIQLVASALKNSLLRPSDVVARKGGDEFVALVVSSAQEGTRSQKEQDFVQNVVDHVKELAIDAHVYDLGKISSLKGEAASQAQANNILESLHSPLEKTGFKACIMPTPEKDGFKVLVSKLDDGNDFKHKAYIKRSIQNALSDSNLSAENGVKYKHHHTRVGVSVGITPLIRGDTYEAALGRANSRMGAAKLDKDSHIDLSPE